MTTMSGCCCCCSYSYSYIHICATEFWWWTKPGVFQFSSSLQHIVFPILLPPFSTFVFYIWPNCCMQMLPGKQAQSNMHNMCCSFIRITVSLQLPQLQLHAAAAAAVAEAVAAAFDGCLCCCLLSYEACECWAKVWEGNKNLLLIKVDNCTVCFI